MSCNETVVQEQIVMSVLKKYIIHSVYSDSYGSIYFVKTGRHKKTKNISSSHFLPRTVVLLRVFEVVLGFIS